VILVRLPPYRKAGEPGIWFYNRSTQTLQSVPIADGFLRAIAVTSIHSILPQEPQPPQYRCPWRLSAHQYASVWFCRAENAWTIYGRCFSGHYLCRDTTQTQAEQFQIFLTAGVGVLEQIESMRRYGSCIIFLKRKGNKLLASHSSKGKRMLSTQVEILNKLHKKREGQRKQNIVRRKKRGPPVVKDMATRRVDGI